MSSDRVSFRRTIVLDALLAFILPADARSRPALSDSPRLARLVPPELPHE